jgi:hypothetical protein
VIKALGNTRGSFNRSLDKAELLLTWPGLPPEQPGDDGQLRDRGQRRPAERPRICDDQEL